MVHLLGGNLGDVEHFNKRLVINERSLDTRQFEEQVLLQLVHLPLVRCHILRGDEVTM